jgi:hypothetical protein
MPNRLSSATSPYLLQHADNPVDWWEWSEAAFAEARERDVPVLLSVGYSACHWCHVMAHESFEDEATAAVMNERFVNVKVDREERPDVDRIYMDAVQAMSGHGGWPMTVFLTPDGRPFFAGTYFPKHDRGGMASFGRVLDAMHDAWTTRRDQVEEQAGTLAAAVAAPVPPASELPGMAELEAAYHQIAAGYDAVRGGFGGAPKFPQAPTLEFLLRTVGEPWAPEAAAMLAGTLHAMARGGIRDHIGGGFSRYSVDASWLVPHFEKMLYDNALLARLYARASQAIDDPSLADVARDTIEYMLRDLLLPDGGFASAEDADSEGEEGRFYVFDHAEVMEAGGEHAGLAAAALGVTPEGTFEGSNIVHLARTPDEVAAAAGAEAGQVRTAVRSTLDALAAIRAGRVRPGLDDKVITAWNGLAIRALAEAGVALDEPAWVEAAERTARFLLGELQRDDGRLLRTWRDGRAAIPAFCDDHAALALGLFALYQATGDPAWYREAARLTHTMVDLFWDDDAGGFFATGADAEELIARPKNLFDNPTPSDNSLAAEALQHLAAFTGDGDLLERMERTIRGSGGLMERFAAGAGHMLAVALVASGPPWELAVVGPEPGMHRLLEVVRSEYRPEVFVAPGGDGETVPLLAGRDPVGGEAAAYLCRGFVCDAPVTDPATLRAALAR